MSGQTRKEKPRDEKAKQASEEPARAKSKADDMDALLDEIDSVLEANAEQFVREYIQKGGQ